VTRGSGLGAAILVLAFVSVLVFSPPAPPAASPTNAATASPSSQGPHDYGPVPAGLPVLYGAAASNRQWLTAFDWQGNARGTLKLAAPLSHELIPEAHCFVLEDLQTFDEVLYVDVPGQPLNRRVGVIVNEGSVGQSGVSAVECNFQRNFAIAVRTSVSGTTDAWAIRLSDAAKLGHWTYDATLGIVPSTDGLLVAENGANGGVTRIRSIPDGAVMSALPAIDAVVAFSDDDRYIVVAPVVSVAPIRVMDWRTKAEVWHYGFPTGRAMKVAVNAGTGDLAIAIGTDEQYYSVIQDYAYAMVIVHPDGTAEEIAGKYFWILPPYADGYYPYKGGPP
jgi:hypothetical protein